MRPFLACLERLGFQLVRQDASNKMFVVLLLRKQRGAGGATKQPIDWPKLKACAYKKR